MGRITRLLKDGMRQYYPYYYAGTYIRLDGPRHEHPRNKKHMYPDVVCSADLVLHAVGSRRVLLDQVDELPGVWYLDRRACRQAIQRAARARKPTASPTAAQRRAARPLLSPATCGSG